MTGSASVSRTSYLGLLDRTRHLTRSRKDFGKEPTGDHSTVIRGFS